MGKTKLLGDDVFWIFIMLLQVPKETKLATQQQPIEFIVKIFPINYHNCSKRLINVTEKRNQTTGDL